MKQADNTENITSSKDDNYLPSCWNDDTRMNALFAPLRNKSVNPQDWESKLTFWRNLIASWCTQKSRCTFTLPELNEAFMRNSCTPVCLPLVINEMLRSKDICPLKEFIEMTSNNTWSSWMMYTFVKKPMVWSFTKLKSTIVAPNNNASETLIHINSIKKQSDTLLKEIPSHLINTVVDLKVLRDKNLLPKTNFEVDVVLNYLISCNKIDIKKMHDKDLIKIYDCEKEKKPISDIDIGIYKLQQQEQTILKNLEDLEIEKGLAVTETKSYLVKGHRQMAKTSLRKKHELEKRIDKRAAALDNVQVLLARVKDAESDSAVLEAYQLGLSTLKSTFKEAGLSEDSVANTMVDLGEVLEIHDDIEKSLSQPCIDFYDVDLEEELAELMNDETGGSDSPKPPRKLPSEGETKELEDTLKKLDIKLPDVPSDVSSEIETDLLTTSP